MYWSISPNEFIIGLKLEMKFSNGISEHMKKKVFCTHGSKGMAHMPQWTGFLMYNWLIHSRQLIGGMPYFLVKRKITSDCTGVRASI